MFQKHPTTEICKFFHFKATDATDKILCGGPSWTLDPHNFMKSYVRNKERTAVNTYYF